MKFSIIVPVYKTEADLPHCIDSLLAQDFNDYEIILVDDGSPDNCPSICDEYAKTDKSCSIRVIHKDNGGLSSARNAGIQASAGDYLCFVDSDDYWINPFALSLLNVVITDHRYDLVQYGLIKEEPYDPSVKYYYNKDFSMFSNLSRAGLYEKLVETDNMQISACLFAVRRSFLLENNLYFKDGIKSEDVEWALRVYSDNPDIGFLSEYVYVYREGRINSITDRIDYLHLCQYIDTISSSIELVDKCDEHNRHALLSYLMYHVAILTALSYTISLTKSEIEDICSSLSRICKIYLLKNTLNRKVRLASIFYRIGGYNLMRFVLGNYLYYRK